MDQVAELLETQDGVISRAQALASGLSRTAIARALRRREWVTVHRGVYVEHTGPLTWEQRAWAAVLSCWPAALADRSALGQHEGPIHLAVDRHRNIAEPAGVRIHRRSGFSELVQWNLAPPRLRYEEVVLDLAATARDHLGAIAVLADACGARRTTAARLLQRLRDRAWIARRAFLEGVLGDVAAGTCSVLEHGYLISSSALTACPSASGRFDTTAPWSTWSTPCSAWSSSWTGCSSTRPLASGTGTSTGTSCTWWSGPGRRCASATGRCSTTPAAPPGGSRR